MITEKNYTKNRERHVSWVDLSYSKFRNQGFLMYPEQEMIYRNIAVRMNGETTIDVGCGIGVGTNILSKKSRVIGVDISDEAVRFARCLYHDIEFNVMDILWPPKDRKFDLVVAVEVIEHLEKVEIALTNMIELAGRTLIFSTPNRNNPRIGKTRPINDLHVAEYTPKEILEMLVGICPGVGLKILDPYSFEELDENTEVTPLVYEVTL